MDWFDSLIDWLKALFLDVFEFLTDLPLELLNSFLGVIADMVLSIPIPTFMTDGLQGIVSSFPSSILWIMGVTGIPECLAIVGAGVAFRLARKLFTLGQW
ncbi:MAG: DUF2523 domain-containing protein [Flavobacteriales bacterium]|nr:DUF2523 domain-containing protein [Flavobacteriales bacterium]